MLLEDFTAHQCGNCPPAGALAAQLAEDNAGRVHPLAIHAGSLAAVSDAPFDTDWTNPEGNLFWDQLAFQVNPIGRVNRRGGPSELFPRTTGRHWSAANWPSAPSPICKGPSFPTRPWRKTFTCTPTSPFPRPSQVRSGWPSSSTKVTSSARNSTTAMTPRSSKISNTTTCSGGSLNGADGLVVATDPAGGSTLQLDYTLVWNEAWLRENSHVLAVLTNADGEVLNCLDLPWTE